MVYLKDLLPNADSTVVFKDTQMPIYQVVASQMGTRAVGTIREGRLCRQGMDPERFVPTCYLDEFRERVEPTPRTRNTTRSHKERGW